MGGLGFIDGLVGDAAWRVRYVRLYMCARGGLGEGYMYATQNK